MKVRVLGCSGAIAKGCRTTSFMIDGDLLVDAGTGVGDLTLDQMRGIRHVLLTHSHLDHVAALPLMIDAVASGMAGPIEVYALGGTIAALQDHVFNDVIWPDFTRIPSPQAPFVQFREIAIGQVLQLGGKRIEVLPALHTVPAVGYSVSSGQGCWVFTGDTGPNPAFWDRLKQIDVALLVIETAFSNRETELAERSLHLSPQTLSHELEGIAADRRFPIYITHTKPAETDLIMSEIQRFDQTDPVGPDARHDIRWLHVGQEFEL